MHAQDFLATLDIRVRHLHLPVKTTWAQQRRVKNVRAVGCRNDDDALIGLETIHFNQELVQRLLALIVTTAVADTTRASHSINLVDKHDTRRVLFRLLEHVAHTRCTDTDEHLNEVRTRDCEERHAGLTGHGTRQKRLTSPGRPHQQSAFRDLAAKAGEFLRIAQELDDLFKVFLGFIDTRDVIKGDPSMLFGQKLGFGLTKTHRTATAAALHPVHEVNPDTDQQEEWQEGDQDRDKARLLLRLGPEGHVILHQKVGRPGPFRLNGDIVPAIGTTENNPLTIDGGIRNISAFNPLDKIRVADVGGIGARLAT